MNKIQGVYRIGFGVTWLFLLVDQDGCVIIDTGLLGEVPLVRRRLRRLGLDWHDVRAILLTHGHLDHTGNLRRLKQLTDAPIYAHPLEQIHIDGKYRYSGWARVAGALESIGRPLLCYRGIEIDHPIHDGDELPFWGGLRVVQLPGHTAGHCGFYSAKRRLLFSGDLFTYWWSKARPSPLIFASFPEQLAEGCRRAAELELDAIIPSHSIRFRPRQALEAFRRTYQERYAPGGG